MDIIGYKDKHEFVSDKGIKSVVYLMDCEKGMAQLDDRSIDLAVVDPPYGINVNPNMGRKKGQKKRHNDITWDDNIPPSSYFEKLFKVSVNQIIWGGNYFPLPPYKHVIFWDKLIPPGMSFSDGEIAWTSFNRAIRKFSKLNPKTIWKIHPTQKPIELYDWIYFNYSQPGQKILDTHLGSQSSRISAHKAGLEFIGFEIDEGYFHKGNERFMNHSNQLSIF